MRDIKRNVKLVLELSDEELLDFWYSNYDSYPNRDLAEKEIDRRSYNKAHDASMALAQANVSQSEATKRMAIATESATFTGLLVLFVSLIALIVHAV